MYDDNPPLPKLVDMSVQTTDTTTKPKEDTEKRDTLIADELRFQEEWEAKGLFRQDAPGPDEPKPPKYFATMAYPCTGMPIKAAADKLAREIEMFGPNFENVPSAELEQLSIDANPDTTKTDASKFSGSKSKAAAKTGKAKYQFEIMLSLGFPREEIKKFSDPYHWLEVFPQLCEADLRRFGARVDWRRSMVTTDANPFYDSLESASLFIPPRDGQACLDHDRSSGEGVTVQEYVALKLKTLTWSEKAKEVIGDKLPQDADVYFIPATLRPETMYGQTCCFVGPTVDYGIFRIAKEGKKDEYYFCSERSARNVRDIILLLRSTEIMAFQDVTSPWGEYHQVVGLKGSDVVGTLVHAPLSVNEKVYILPMATVKPTKGTGVVTCVPSDSPDDYATTLDLRKKPEFYGIQKEWLPEEILPIIKTPSSDLIAKHLVETMKINSPKDQKLAEAKDIAYKEGFYSGTMIYGPFSGLSVQEAKPLVKRELIESGLAFNYGEPDGLVMSRSGDECVAAYLDQWYWAYGQAENGGDQKWFEDAYSSLETGTTNCFFPEGKHAMETALKWLGQWACSRSFGLGTKLPWDDSQLVESLSDSTVYMAYYTVCHVLHSDIYGKTPGRSSKPISPSQMTEGVWDYIFDRTDKVDDDITIPRPDLDLMRNEFKYWYPLDVRISGKDLARNHLLFFLYHHVALFDKAYWPRGIRLNGHLMLNGEKMAKSTGNFLTLRDAVEKYGADATRIALADGGDGIEDANLEESVCNATILRLYELRRWCHDSVKDTGLRTGEYTLWEKLWNNEMNILVSETFSFYEATSFKLALKSGFYDFIASRDWYRDITRAVGVSMHSDLVKRFTELQALLLAPIAPHFSEGLYRDVLGNGDSIQQALWPQVPAADAVLSATFSYLRSVTSNITAAEGAQMKKISKGKTASYDPKEKKRLIISVAKSYPEWQVTTMNLLAKQYQETGAVDVKELTKQIDKKEIKKVMPFVQSLKKRLDLGEKAADVFSHQLPFDEAETLQEIVPSLKQTIPKLEAVEINMVEGESEGKAATPGNPVFTFENIK
ncbi:hypothetical protein NPX13_g5070 [Xylaria arbuscula]|uniref:leucine--tRNA ligase n=1 Tax=Xylaria arbuscula TaxID=114810 RepID=A0A9W8TN16_9PEZI|nr:hypothetical protein NPX13_g5070 [Xylaria arbuscula]